MKSGIFSKTTKAKDATKPSPKPSPTKPAQPATPATPATPAQPGTPQPVAPTPGTQARQLPNNWGHKALRFKATFPQAGDINLQGTYEEVSLRIQQKLGKTPEEADKIIAAL